MGDVRELTPDFPDIAYTTLMTTLDRLYRKGVLAREKQGRAFVYRPVIDQKQARRRALSHLVARLFNNSLSLLVTNVLEDEQIDPAEIARLKSLLDSH